VVRYRIGHHSSTPRLCLARTLSAARPSGSSTSAFSPRFSVWSADAVSEEAVTPTLAPGLDAHRCPTSSVVASAIHSPTALGRIDRDVESRHPRCARGITLPRWSKVAAAPVSLPPLHRYCGEPS
jgi:hypothetical protein